MCGGGEGSCNRNKCLDRSPGKGAKEVGKPQVGEILLCYRR